MGESISRSFVQQDAYYKGEEQGAVALRLNPRGELVVPDWMTQLALDGRVFNISNAVLETANLFGETARGTDNINPSILVDVPSGTTIVPLEIVICTSGTGTAGDITIQVCTDDGVRYSSGGAAVTPVNMRKDDPATSACTAYQGGTQIVAIANVDDDTIDIQRIDELQIAAPTVWPYKWSAKDHIPPILIGPASLLVYVIVGNVDASFFWTVKWWEAGTVYVT